MDANAQHTIPHGGCLAAARIAYPDAPAPFIDLSTGINPHAYHLPPFAAETLTRLPEPEQEAALRIAAAAAYGAGDPAMVAAAPGTQILINLLPRLFPCAAIDVLGPTYAEHAAAWRAAGATVREIAELPNDCAGGAVVCNPNNPDGRRLLPDRLLELADRLAAHDGLLVVDEAFADLEAPPLSLVPALPHPAIVVLRSFGKTYGLAGLRLGFALAAPARAAILRAALGPWAVSGPAIAAGIAALADAAWLARTRQERTADASRLDALLQGAGLSIIGGTVLFRLAEHTRAAAIHDHLARAGLLVRRFEAHPSWLRFGIPPDEAAWTRLVRALG